MRAEYDSEADALSIDLRVVDQWDRAETLADGLCNVAFCGEEPVNVELLGPADHLDLLDLAAARFGFDAQALQAAARSALAAPDRAVTVEVAAPA